MKTLNVGFPSNENAAATETYATLTIDGYEARFAMTGITAIVNALQDGLDTGRLSAYSVKEAITAFELLHERMWELCDAEDVDT